MIKFGDIIFKAVICFVVSLAVLFALGIFTLFWSSYRNARKPVFSARVLNCRIRDDYYNEMIKEIAPDLEIKEFHCFIFQGHPSRNIYDVILVGKTNEKIGHLADGKTFSFDKYSKKKIFRALELSGADPQKDDTLKEFAAFGYVYAYDDNWLVISTARENDVFLKTAEQKLEFLKLFIHVNDAE